MKNLLLAFAALLLSQVSLSQIFSGSHVFNDISVNVLVDYSTNKVNFVIEGPSTKWFAVGFGSKTMANTYCVMLNEGNVQSFTERKLGNHNYGSTLANSLTLESYTALSGKSTYVLSRDLTGSTSDHYTFPNNISSIEFIIAKGSNTGQYHGSDYVTSDMAFSIASSNNEIENKTELKLYPNPAENQLNISFTNAAIKTVVKIIDVNGKTVKNVSFSNLNQLTLDVTDLPSGKYIAMVSNDQFHSGMSFIKK